MYIYIYIYVSIYIYTHLRVYIYNYRHAYLSILPWSSQNMPTPMCAPPKLLRTNQICKATLPSLDTNTKLPQRLQENTKSLKEPAWKAGKGICTNKKISQKRAYATPTDSSIQALKSPKIGFATLRRGPQSAQ